MSENEPAAEADEEEMTFEKAHKYRKYSSYLAAVLLVVVSILKIVSLSDGHKM